MAFDIILEHEGHIYQCSLSEHLGEEYIFYIVDVRSPGTGTLLNTQINNLELHFDLLNNRYEFKSYTRPIPEIARQLEAPLNTALQNITGRPAVS